MFESDTFSTQKSHLSPAKRALFEKLMQGKFQDTTIQKRQQIGSEPLSFAQERLWFLEQLNPDRPLYNEPIALRLLGAINLVALKQSLNEIVRRHEVLRTTFTAVEGQPIQVIAPTMNLVVPILNLQSLSSEEQDIEVQRIATEEAKRSFNLVEGPLVRLTLLQLGESKHILLLTMHHIVCDRWSFAVLIREVVALYEAFTKGHPSPLPELPIQYADFAIWQRQWLVGEVLEKQVSYWIKQLNGAPTLLELPTDHPRPAIISYRGAKQSLVVPKKVIEALKALSQQQGATLFMTLLAAFKILLYRYSQQEDILVGTPVAGRNRTELEGLIGFFVNTLVLRTNLSGNPSFRELLAKVREITLEAFAHQDLPFEQLVEKLQPQRNLSHTPLFQVMFQLHNNPTSNLELPGLTWIPLELDNETAKFDLTLTMAETEQGLIGSLKYNTELFNVSRITRLLNHFQTLLEAIVANPDQAISNLPLLTDAERHQLLVEWNDTQANYHQEQCIHNLFEEQVERSPHTIAVIFDNQQLTYRELNDRANQLAKYLQAIGVGSEVLVGICIERSLEMVIGLLAILKAGGAYLPLDPLLPQQRLAFMLADSQGSVLLTQKHLVTSLGLHSSQVICIDSDWENIAAHNQNNPVTNAQTKNLAYTIYTSGSTGKPKGVQITHYSVINFLTAMQKQLGLTDRDTLVAVTTLSFDIAVLEIFLPLLVGARVVLVSREIATDGTKLLQQLSSCGATLMQATPATWRMLLEAGWQRTAQLKILCGGEVLQEQLAEQLGSRGVSVWNLYGPTETTVWSAIHHIDERISVSIGHPIANTQIYILDQYLQPVPIGIPGEVYIGGAGLARGYLKRPELTAEKFIPDPFSDKPGARLYRTGDLAHYLPNGEIELKGRIDHQVKIRGFRIELGEIEATLNQHACIRQAVVVSSEDELGDKRLVAYVSSHPQQTLQITQLRIFLKEKLPEYMVPAAFVIIPTIPLLANGKVDRRALPVPYQVHPQLENVFAVPLTPVEEMLTGIWVKLLGMKQVGIHDNFFELGGHSLLATRLISQLRKAFEVELSLRCLFESPTIAELAQKIETKLRAGKKSETPPIRPATQREHLPLSFAQQRLWFIDQLIPGNPSYNISAAVRLKGSLNITALEQSLNEIIRRHEALRTTFQAVDGRPMQVIAPTLKLNLPVTDLQALSDTEQEAQVQQLSIRETQQPFDLACAPLLRITLLKLCSSEHVVLFTMHHIISDGWSMGVLIREVATLYQAFLHGKPSPLPELPIQYADFAVWQRQWLQGEVLENQLAYWKKHLGGSLPVLQLPYSQRRPAMPTNRGGVYSFKLSPQLSKELQSLSHQGNATLFMTMLAALQTLLHRYTGQDDIIVGTDVANRNQAEIETLIGFFVNLLVLRTYLGGYPTFEELLQRVREVAMSAYAHQDLPFEKLVEELQPERHQQPAPLFQVLFVMQNAPTQKLELEGLTIIPLKVENRTAKFDLALFVSETDEGIVGTWHYNADIFDKNAIARIAGHYETLLNSIVAQPNARINTLEMLTPDEKKEQVMTEVKQEASKLKKFMSVKPKAVKLPQGELIKTDYLQPGQTLPLVLQPNVNDIDVIDWAKSNRQFIETKLQHHGAILFRGFDINSVSVFENLAQAICPELFGEYGDLPREGVGGKVYGSTPYPPDQAILFHNESSHMHCYPLKIWFFCVQPAQTGGETPIVDCRKVYQLLAPKLQEIFEKKQLMYVRNYIEGLDVSWQEFFHTTDKAVVEEYCRKANIEFEWLPNNGLRTRKLRPAVVKHIRTGEQVFFNQLQLHHVSCLNPSVRDSLLSIFGEENLPRNVYYGDGSPIEDAVMAKVNAVYEQAAVSFPWQQGDVLMLDNMLTAHGRYPYAGARKIVVAMGEMFQSENM